MFASGGIRFHDCRESNIQKDSQRFLHFGIHADIFFDKTLRECGLVGQEHRTFQGCKSSRLHNDTRVAFDHHGRSFFANAVALEVGKALIIIAELDRIRRIHSVGKVYACFQEQLQCLAVIGPTVRAQPIMDPLAINVECKVFFGKFKGTRIHRFSKGHGEHIRRSLLERLRAQERSRDNRRHTVVHAEHRRHGGILVTRDRNRIRHLGIAVSLVQHGIRRVDVGKHLLYIVLGIVQIETDDGSIFRKRNHAFLEQRIQVLELEFMDFALRIQPVQRNGRCLEIVVRKWAQETDGGAVHSAIAVAVVESVVLVGRVNATGIAHRHFTVLPGLVAVGSLDAAINRDANHIAHFHDALIHLETPLVTIFLNGFFGNFLAIQDKALALVPRGVNVLVELDDEDIRVILAIQNGCRLNDCTDMVNQVGTQRIVDSRKLGLDRHLQSPQSIVARSRHIERFKIHFGFKLSSLALFVIIRMPFSEVVLIGPAVSKICKHHGIAVATEPSRNLIPDAIAIRIKHGSTVEVREIAVVDSQLTRKSSIHDKRCLTLVVKRFRITAEFECLAGVGTARIDSHHDKTHDTVIFGSEIKLDSQALAFGKFFTGQRLELQVVPSALRREVESLFER